MRKRVYSMANRDSGGRTRICGKGLLGRAGLLSTEAGMPAFCPPTPLRSGKSRPVHFTMCTGEKTGERKG